MTVADMTLAKRIEAKLTAAFQPTALRVVDESHHHAGHAGARPDGESHFRLYIVAESFRGRSRLDRHRMVNDVLIDELAGQIHALAIHATAPGE